MIGIDSLTIHTGWKICTDIKVSETANGKKRIVFGASSPRPDNNIWVKKYFAAFGYMADEIEKAFKDGVLAMGTIIPAIYANERPYKYEKKINMVHEDGKVGEETISYTQYSYDIVNISLPVNTKEKAEPSKTEPAAEKPKPSAEPDVINGLDGLMDFMNS